MTIQEALQRSQELEELTEAAAVMAMEICRKYMARERSRKNYPAAMVEDAAGRFALKLTQRWQTIKPDGKPEAFLKRMAHTCLMDELRKYDQRRRLQEKIFEADEEKNSNELKYVTPISSPFIGSVLRTGGVKDGRKLTKDQQLALREEAVRQLKMGMSQSRIAKFLGVSKTAVQRWAAKFKKSGVQGLRFDKRGKYRRGKAKGKRRKA